MNAKLKPLNMPTEGGRGWGVTGLFFKKHGNKLSNSYFTANKLSLIIILIVHVFVWYGDPKNFAGTFMRVTWHSVC